MSELETIIEHEELIIYNEAIRAQLPAEFCQELDQAIVEEIGADSAIVWRLGGKIYLRKVTFTMNDDLRAVAKAELISSGAAPEAVDRLSDDELCLSELQLGKIELDPGYYPDQHLYAINGKIYVDDDYIWCGISNQESVYDDGAYYGDEEYLEDEEEVAAAAFAQEAFYTSIGTPVWLNLFMDRFNKDSTVKYEPLVVDNFNLDNPVLKVEIAYRNALCEIENQPTCGWIVLLHDGHFYIPVESVEDQVNHETYYYLKIFNSYPAAVSSPRIAASLIAEIFGLTFRLAIRYRAGYCVNWRKLFFERLLPSDYKDRITDFYSVSDKPYGSNESDRSGSDFDGFDLHFPEDDED